MLNLRRLLILLSIVCFTPPAVAWAAAGDDTTAGSHGEDEDALTAQAAEYEKAFAAGDSKALANMWSLDGTYTTSDGRELVGRDAIEQFFAAGFKNWGAKPIDITVQSIRFPAGNVAIEEGTSRLQKGPASGMLSRYSVVHVKENGKWQMSAVTEIDGARGTKERLQDLDWLIGTWTAKGPKGSIQFKADWAGDQKFIHCTYKTEGSAKPQQVQLIGWNPLSGNIASWHFDSSGGFGRGMWTRDGQSWIENAAGIESDGTIGSGINVIRKLDDNSFNWRSTGRILGGRPLPDTVDITVTRVQSSN